VRFHGLLSDDIGTVVKHNDQLMYSFFNADQIVDFLLSIDMRPFVELSFMPTALASGSTTVFRYRGNATPPKDYKQWSTFIHTLVPALWPRRCPGPRISFSSTRFSIM
jgi:xylan 1,4-beta-xylosidase